MKQASRVVLVLMMVLAPALVTVWANCTAIDSQPVWNGLGGTIANCPDALPVQAWAYRISDPLVTNSNNQDMVCRHEGQQLTYPAGAGVDCSSVPGSGIDGDDVITLYYEWGIQNGTQAGPSAGALGCPNTAQSGYGTNPVAVDVVCNNGAGAHLEIGYTQDYLQYLVEFAQNPPGTPIMAGFQNGSQIVSVTPQAGPSPSAANVCVNLLPPTSYSDCNPGAEGFDYTCPSGSVRPALSRGRLFAREAPCGSQPGLRAAEWVPLGIQPDSNGDACNVIQNPTTPGNCAFIGNTLFYGANETGGMTSWFQVAGQAAATDKVKIDSAKFDKGNLIVDFSTLNETSILGFNVYTGSTKLNGGLISARGTGSNPYTFEVGRGALKGGKSIYVEAVKGDGTVEKTAPVALK